MIHRASAGGGKMTKQVIWDKMADLRVMKWHGKSDREQRGRMKEIAAKAKNGHNKCEHLNRVSGMEDYKRMREKKKHIACGSYTETVQGIHRRMGVQVLLVKYFGWSGD